MHLDVHGDVATVTLDSPADRNALSERLRADLYRQVALALSEEAVRVVVLAHTGRVFCSGMVTVQVGPAV